MINLFGRGTQRAKKPQGRLHSSRTSNSGYQSRASRGRGQTRRSSSRYNSQEAYRGASSFSSPSRYGVSATRHNRPSAGRAKRRRRDSILSPRKLIPALLAGILVLALGGGTYWFLGRDTPPLKLDASQYSLEVQNALYDVREISNTLVDRHNTLQDYRYEALESTSNTWAYEASIDPTIQSIREIDVQARGKLVEAKGVIEEASNTNSRDRGLKAYIVSIDSIIDALDLEVAIFDIRADYVQATKALTEKNWSAQKYANALDSKIANLEKLTDSPTYGNIIQEYIEEVKIEKASLGYLTDSGRANFPLYSKQFEELVDWGMKAAVKHELDISWIVNHSIVNGRDLTDDGEKEPIIDIRAEDSIMPNIYNHSEGLGLLSVSVVEDQDITVKAEVPGFTEKFEQDVHVKAGNNYLRVKPAILSSLTYDDLDEAREGQINIEVLSKKGKEKYFSASEPVTLYSLYDMIWGDTLHGHLRYFDILSWMRPEDDGIHELITEATKKLPEITEGRIKSISQDNQKTPEVVAATIAALQLAITDHNMTYAKTGYSFKASQHVLTADQVLVQEHGVCVETSLLVASALEAAGFHTILIFPPGHTQVAVEVDSGGGQPQFLLIETTLHPYEVDERRTWRDPHYYRGLIKTDSHGNFILDARQWQEYINSYDEFYVVDTELAKVMNLHGFTPKDE